MLRSALCRRGPRGAQGAPAVEPRARGAATRTGRGAARACGVRGVLGVAPAGLGAVVLAGARAGAGTPGPTDHGVCGEEGLRVAAPSPPRVTQTYPGSQSPEVIKTRGSQPVPALKE